MPATTGTVITTGDSNTVTNTMLAGSITNAKLANSSVTLGNTALTLGATITTVAGLTSVTSTTFTSNVAVGTAPLVVTSTTQVANLNVATAGLATYATTANAVAGANVSGTVANANAAVYISTTDSPSSSSNCSLVFSLGSGVGQTLYQDTAGLIYKPSTNTLYTTNFVGTLTGNASSATMVQVDVLGSGTQYILLGSVGMGVGQTPMTYSTLVYTSSNNTMVTNINGSITTNTITTGSNVTAGTITGNWSLSAGSRLNATYADLAEYYEADAAYEPGTVLEFGGDKEVTIAEDSTIKVAGVISTNPAYIMNSLCLGTHTVAIALQGRVPTKVRGKIRKGDMLISGGNGFARPAKTSPMMGTVIGKALENFDGEGVIEVAISRM